MQRFLNGAVGKRKQNALLGCLVSDGFPARNDENIVALPVHCKIVADVRASPPFNGHEDSRVG